VELIRLRKHNRNPPRAGKILRNKWGNEHKASRERKGEAYHFDSKKVSILHPLPTHHINLNLPAAFICTLPSTLRLPLSRAFKMAPLIEVSYA
jgi:hypothetical protein